MSAGQSKPEISVSEGDVNLSPRRREWQRSAIDAETAHWLEEDARYFLHQALSTPCLDVLARCSGAYLEDLQGRKFLDFHGNSVHQVGFGHPKVASQRPHPDSAAHHHQGGDGLRAGNPGSLPGASKCGLTCSMDIAIIKFFFPYLLPLLMIFCLRYVTM